MSDIDNDSSSDTFENKNQEIISPERYVFWMNDITVLFRDGNYMKFIPTAEMTRVEQLNALTRFFLYLIIVLFMFDKTDEFMYVPIVGVIMVIVLYNIFEVDEKGKRDELLRMKKRKEAMRNVQSDLNYRTYQIDDDGDVVTIDIDQEEQQRYNDEKSSDSPAQTDYDLEAGYYDSNGKLHTGGFYDAVQSLKEFEKKRNIKYSLDEMRLYESAKCRKPTVDNPFMNPSVADFNSEDVPVACNADDEDIKKSIDLKFNEDLYRDIEDVFDRKNSQRQFYTIAHNIPNDQEAFAKWCYKFPTTCKTNQERCLRYEDLRTKY
ncbi:hypothetical protein YASMINEVIRUS_756 [Yasminevirus sp. GU-2018]|uniref:Minor capsid protein P9 transmembrane helices domain-containing protein n=1 Tax=Yasminevirus sp. GU-2018 TaxID=2420051 RepID=A0A5K0UA23_9VIRU|nr:hypothetical protein YASMINEVIRUS_756 [Yasminevirus sp. GU-2018]